jgi:hypothetical protein
LHRKHLGLFALAAHDLRVHLVGTGVEQLDGSVFQLPHIAIQAQTGFSFRRVYSLAGDQRGGFNS